MVKVFKAFAVATLFMFAQFAHAAEWYEGGTLHSANGLEWQQASYENKLATVGDFVSSLYNNKKFKSELQSEISKQGMNGLKSVSVLIVENLDAAFEPVSDPEENRKLFTNQKVDQMTVMVMTVGGLLKAD